MTGSGRDGTEVLGLVRQLPLLGAVSRVARRAVRRQVSQERLPDAQIEVLRTVEAHPGIGTRAVAEWLQLVPNTVSTLVGDLVRAGLLRRARDRSDRRAARLYLTEEAVARLQDWVAAGDEVLSTALLRLDEADRQVLETAMPALRRLLEVLDDADEGDVEGAGDRGGDPAHGASPRGTTSGRSESGSRSTSASTP
ncbi:MarR family winged helix-turn-helix transcriptional regulator [Streptomyces sp. DSM 3412]|uniref:MarR family winged helix-turn-helix transcriptional regulator n=1 Tax=Streptomyces gottesmaniae TaxID=3075518 RepID=A0ABU2YPS4_9ACTN|nr:MarR family winged helix-turn-helix transcriptional regulator [Streptomyces sp. DSM 3412]MDT0566334.1 MarR family winged helix-turn-helix transcriptional regulator [Streptomyces sp. DSM 3412]